MMQKYLILIDDHSQYAKLEQIKNTLDVNENIELTYKEYNPTDFQKRENGDVVFNKEAFIKDLKQLPFLYEIDSIVCDYHLGDMINGFEILKIIKEAIPHYKKQIILYSTDINKVIGGIIEGADFESKRNNVKYLVSFNPEFVNKDGFEQMLIPHLKSQEPFSFEDELIKWFRSRKEDEFNYLFPKYQGKKFEEVAECLKADSQDSIEFKQELIQQIIAYLSKINDLSDAI